MKDNLRYLAIVVMMAFVVAFTHGCAGTDYGGTNYVTVDTGQESWKVVGGKDETNVSFSVKRPDGTEVIYTAEGANASAALAGVVQQQQQLLQSLTPLLQQAVKVAAP